MQYKVIPKHYIKGACNTICDSLADAKKEKELLENQWDAPFIICRR